MEQNTPKFRLRLNLFDAIVLVLALLVGAVLAYTVLKPSGPVEGDASISGSTVQYTVCFRKMLEGTGALVQPGDQLVDNIKNYKIGTVVSTEIVPAKTRAVDQFDRKVVQAEIPGYEDVYVTVQADGVTSDEAILLDGGFVLRVNMTAYIKGEGYMASGPIIAIEREGQA